MYSEMTEESKKEEKELRKYINFVDFSASKRTGADYFSHLSDLRNAYTPRPPGQAKHEDVEKFVNENECARSLMVVPPQPPSEKYSGRAYFDQLHEIYDESISRLLMGGLGGGGGNVKSLEEIVAARCGNYTFNVSGVGWYPIEFSLGVSVDDVEAGSSFTYKEWLKYIKRRCSFKFSKKVGWKYMLFQSSMYLSQQRLEALVDPSVTVQPELLELQAKAQQKYNEAIKLSPDFDPSSFRWSSLAITTDKASKRCISEKFIEAHNQNVAAMQAIIDDPSSGPRYGTWPKRSYADRLRSDRLLLKAAHLRDELEELIAVMRYEARLAIAGVEVQPPYFEPSNSWQKLLARSHRKKKKKALFDFEKEVPEVEEVDTGTLRRWAVGYGDVEIKQDITWSAVRGVPTRPECGRSPEVTGQEALQWAFYSSKTLKSYHRFTLPKADGVTVIFDFERMSTEVTVKRGAETQRRVLPLDRLFAIPADTLDQRMEIKLLSEEDYALLEEGRKNKEYLHWSIKTGHIDSAMEIADKVADVNAVDRAGFTALHLACIGNHVGMVERLLELGANTRLIDQKRNTCLHLAIANDHIDLALMLIERGCDIDPKNNQNREPLECFSSKDVSNQFFFKTKIESSVFRASHFALWFYFVQLESSEYDGIEERVLEIVRQNLDFGYAKDANGRIAVEMATPQNKAAINSEYLWYGRYRVAESRPEHTSATCYVFKAFDEENVDDAGNAAPVALKLMRMKGHFLREINARKHDFSVDYVVDIIARFPRTDAEVDSWPDVAGADTNERLNITKAEAEKFFCIVMPLANRNMFVAFKQERFAGRNMEEVKHVFVQLVKCVEHMHSKGVLHADLKTLNVVRINTQWKLIDMDATCVIGKDAVGFKSSSAYVPPEAIFVNADRTRACVRSVECDEYELLVSQESFDVWSLGCILYQMCNADVKPLFQGGQDDNLSTDAAEDDSLYRLERWDNAYRNRKLQRITDPLAKNLLTQMLARDPKSRPLLDRVLAHPFLSSKKVARLVGEEAAYDVFISYRVASDAVHAELLHKLLTAQGKRVWWDKVCLEPGVEWKEGFCAGLVNSRAFVCILSPGAINHLEIDWQNFSKLTPESRCDNVFLEHRLALELKGLGLIDYVYPVMIGNAITDGAGDIASYENFFTSGGRPNAPDCAVHSVEADLRHHMESQALGSPLEENRTVASVMNAILACQGGAVQGEKNAAWEGVVGAIMKMLNGKTPEEGEGDGAVGAGAGAGVDSAALAELMQELEVARARIKSLESELAARETTPRPSSVDVTRQLLRAKDAELLQVREELALARAQLATSSTGGGSGAISDKSPRSQAAAAAVAPQAEKFPKIAERLAKKASSAE